MISRKVSFGLAGVGIWLAGCFPATQRAQTAAVAPSDRPPAPAGPVPEPAQRVPATDPRVAIMGRHVADEDGTVSLSYPGVTLSFCMRGSKVALVGSSSSGRTRFLVRVDGTPVAEVVLPAEQAEVGLWADTADLQRAEPVQEGLSSADSRGAIHCVQVVHLTETWLGEATVKGLAISGELIEPPAQPERRLLFVGDSVTCGEAVRRTPECSKNETWWDADNSYGALVARTLNAQHQLVCYGGRGMVRDWQGKTELNAPQFVSLAIPDQRGRSWDMQRYIPDAIVVNLGTNDFNLALGDFPERRHFVETYLAFVERLREHFPQALLFVTEGAIVNDEGQPSPGQKTILRSYLREVVSKAASSSVVYLPAEHYPGDVCDPHPTGDQHAKIATDLVAVLRAKLNWND